MGTRGNRVAATSDQLPSQLLLGLQVNAVAPEQSGPAYVVLRYADVSRELWDNFIESSVNGWITDTSDWVHFFCSDCGYGNLSFVIETEGAIRLAFPLYLVPNLFGGHRIVSGPFFDRSAPIVASPVQVHLMSAVRSHIARLVHETRATSVEIRDPYAPLPDTVATDCYCRFILELNRPIDELFSSLAENSRRAIRKAEKVCRVSVSDRPADLSAVWELYRLTMHSHGTPPWGPRFRDRFIREIALGRARVITASRDGICIGGALLWGNKTLSRLEISACPSAEAKTLQINSLLFWNAMVVANQLGSRQLDLTRTLVGSSHYNFKKRWGGTEVPLPFVYFGSDPPRDPRQTWVGYLSKIGRLMPAGLLYRFGDSVRTRLAM